MDFDIKKINVLIVEDDQEKREELAELLRDIGIELKNIQQVKYAEKAIEIVNDDLPEVVLLDLKIPFNPDNESINIKNSNLIIKEVERVNAARNNELSSTGIIVISASVDDQGLQENYKHNPDIVDFLDKDEIALDEDKFKGRLLKRIKNIARREFSHDCKIELPTIRKIKLNKLKEINLKLYERIVNDLLERFAGLNNKKANVKRDSEMIIGLAGRIVEDIINLFHDENVDLLPIDESDNFSSVRNKLNNLTGRRWNNSERKLVLIGTPKISRRAAEYARFAYQLRSEALHSKEGDIDNKKLFNTDEFAIEDAAISINLIMPLVQEFINFKNNS